MLSSGLNAIDALLEDYAWVATKGTPKALTYSFMVYPPSKLTAGDLYGLTQMTVAQQSAVAQAFATWAAVANITFSQVTESSSSTGGQIRFADNNQGSVSAAYTLAYSGPSVLIDAYIFLNTASHTNSSFSSGSYGLLTLIHEIGHALGLKHPGDYNAGGGGASPPYLPTATDTLDYTVMSYNDGTARTSSSSYPAGPMLYDIQAIQYLYGANMSYRTGDDTYSFSNSSLPVCVWDAGGTNTFDFSACTQKVVIDLNAGGFSQTRPGVNNVSIAYGVSIQKAIAGSGGSTIYCNNLADTITGGVGNDLVVVGTGSSIIDGGGGSNTLQVTTAAHDISHDTISRMQTLDMNNQTVTITVAQLASFQSFLNSSGGVVFADSGTIQAVTAVTSYTLANGANSLTLATLPGHYTVTGDAGIDTVILGGSGTGYGLGKTINGYTVTSITSTGSVSVTGVERLQASDIKLAVDLSGAGHAAQTVELLGAAFGKSYLTPSLVGAGLSLFDGGMTMHDVCQLALSTDLFKDLAGSTSNTAFVNLVYQNVVGVRPDSATLAYFVGMLQGSGGTMSQADLLAYAAISDTNLAHIDLVGLQATGVAYL